MLYRIRLPSKVAVFDTSQHTLFIPKDIEVASIEPIQSFLSLYINYYIVFFYYIVVYIKASEALYWFHATSVSCVYS